MATILSSAESPNYYGDCTMQVPMSRFACNDFPKLTVQACDLPTILKRAAWKSSVLLTSSSPFDITPQLIIGTSSGDTLHGGYGADTINGGKGDDVLFGGFNVAPDAVTSGSSTSSNFDIWFNKFSSDTFVFKKGDGKDTIRDVASDSLDGFGQNSEVIKFTDVKSTEVRFSSDNGYDLIIHYGLTDQIKIFYPTNGLPMLGGSALTSIVFSDGVTWSGSTLSNKIFSAFATTQNGTSGNDKLTGFAGKQNVLNGLAGNDTLIGAELNDRLFGGAGDDYLDGRAGRNTLTGGLGNDTYVVNTGSAYIVEAAGQGTDRVLSNYTHDLMSNVENLVLTGSLAADGYGNELNNILTGNSAANRLEGYVGNDRLNGRGGADTLVGGLGNDTYVINSVDSAASIVELAGQGLDKVLSSVSYTLGANIENLTLANYDGNQYTALGMMGLINPNATLGAAINGTGNSLNNTIAGNNQSNVLTGKKGNDTLKGGHGQDVFVFSRGDGQDVIADIEMPGDLHTYSEGPYYRDSDGNPVDMAARYYYQGDLLSGTTPVTPMSEDNEAVCFTAGVTNDQLWFRHENNNLVIQIIGTTDKITINNYYSATTTSQLNDFSVVMSDKKIIVGSQIENLVAAMAAFTPPAAGQTTLPSNYQTALAPVIAANWH